MMLTLALVSMLTLSYPTEYISDKNVAASVSEKYDMEPDSVKALFVNEGWSLNVVPGNKIAGYYNGSFSDEDYILSGVTDSGKKDIYVSDREDYGINAVNHEMGHFLDLSSNRMYSDMKKFKDIYKEEKDNGVHSEYIKSSPTEYFAESYCMYIEKPDVLQKMYPKTYAYMDGIVSHMQNTEYSCRYAVYKMPEFGIQIVREEK